VTSATADRRRLLAAAAATGAAIALGNAAAPGTAAAAPTRTRRRPGTRPVQPRSARALLLRRAAWGPTTQSLADVTARGLTGWVDWQLDPQSMSDPGGDAVNALYPEMNWTITQARNADLGWELMSLTAQYQVARAIWSRRQLVEVMVDFWHDVLHVAVPSDGLESCAHDYDRTVIRAHALGRYADMLKASAKHPAMLRYLNNADSSKNGLNENYGREVLELHTAGIDGGYTEAMMLDSARIMTGWTIDWNTGLANYRSSWHWTGPVNVLGFTSPNSAADGRPVVEAYLDHLARHPSTAHHLAYRLARRFVADDPPLALVDELAALYLAHDTDVRPMVRRLFTGRELRSAYATKVKRPLEDVVSTVRILGHQLLASGTTDDRRRGVRALYWIAGDLRQAPLEWSTPDGYPDVAVEWQAADGALGRWNMHQSVAAGWWPNKDALALASPQSLLPSPTPTTAGALVDALSRRLFDGLLRSDHRAAVLTFMNKQNGSTLPANDQWLGWRLQELVALLLNTPAHGLR
jgi:uncharacterized protein (DUF1800 family)